MVLILNSNAEIIYFNNIILQDIVRKKRKIDISSIIYEFLKLPIIVNCSFIPVLSIVSYIYILSLIFTRNKLARIFQ